MRTGTRSTLASLAVMALLATGCAPAGNSAQERLSTVVAAVTGADERVTHASAQKSVSGLSSGWVVDIVLSGSEPVTPDEFRALLLAARHAGDYNPSHVDIFATDEAGEVVDLTAAADALGLRYSEVGSGVGIMRNAIVATLGAD